MHARKSLLVASPKTTAGHSGTEVSAYEDLERFTTRDREFQELSASLCKRCVQSRSVEIFALNVQTSTISEILK